MNKPAIIQTELCRPFLINPAHIRVDWAAGFFKEPNEQACLEKSSFWQLPGVDQRAQPWFSIADPMRPIIPFSVGFQEIGKPQTPHKRRLHIFTFATKGMHMNRVQD